MLFTPTYVRGLLATYAARRHRGENPLTACTDVPADRAVAVSFARWEGGAWVSGYVAIEHWIRVSTEPICAAVSGSYQRRTVAWASMSAHCWNQLPCEDLDGGAGFNGLLN